MKCCDPCCIHIPQQSLQQFKVQTDFWKNVLHRTAAPEEIKVNTGKTLLAWTVCTFFKVKENTSHPPRPHLDFWKCFYKHTKLKASPLSLPIKIWLYPKGIFKQTLLKLEIFSVCTHYFFQKGSWQETNPFPSLIQLAFKLKMVNYPEFC